MISLKKVIYSWVDRNFLGGCSSYNTLTTRKNCRSKQQARQIFAENEIPHAHGELFYTPLKPIFFARRYGFPLCIKPNVSGFSRGSYFPITSYWELLRAALFVKIWWPSSMVEQYLSGKNYRVVVVENDIMSIIRRYPPFVIGDGKSTIEQLIDRENSIREKMGLYPVIHAIPKNSAIQKFLKKKGMSLSSIPADMEEVELFNRISLAPGGVVEVVEKEQMHPENKELFLRLIPVLKANILGVDAIFEKGIEVSYRQQKVIFLEINSRPYLKMHDYPRYGKKENLESYYTHLNNLQISEQDVF